MYGEGAITDPMCQKWFVTFRAGDPSLDNAPQSVDQLKLIADQIETLPEKNQCSPT